MKVVLVTIDALQPAYLGPYGNEWIETPTFDRLAAGGVVFDQHFADVPSADTRSWRTGGHAALPPEPATDLCRKLEESGVRITSVRRGRRTPLADLSTADRALVTLNLGNLLPPWKLPAKTLAPFFAAEPADDDEETPPLEPWLDGLPPQIDDDDAETFARIQNTYAAAVAQLDAHLGKIVADSAEHGWANAVWVVTSDRGLALGEHGTAGFPTSLHEELVHLPLLVFWPDGTHAGRRVSTLTQPMDLAPTIAEFFGISWPGASDSLTTGRSLLPLVHSPHSLLRSHAVTLAGAGIGVRSADWYWMRAEPGATARLFVKPDDRWEVNDVCQQHGDACDELEGVAREFTKQKVSLEAK
jgi:arylsulfatase A-like enzyme